jgi:hypothetical protein
MKIVASGKPPALPVKEELVGKCTKCGCEVEAVVGEDTIQTVEDATINGDIKLVTRSIRCPHCPIWNQDSQQTIQLHPKPAVA